MSYTVWNKKRSRQLSFYGIWVSSLLLIAFLGVHLVSASTSGEDLSNILTVTSLQDRGTGTLRQAIDDANAQAGHNIIVFDMDAQPDENGMFVIQLETLLPPITDGVTLDGTSQAGYAADTGPVIELDGTQVEKTCAGIESGYYQDHPGLDIRKDNSASIDASGTIVAGLKISGFCQGISVTGVLTPDAESSFPNGNCTTLVANNDLITNVIIRDNVFEKNQQGNSALGLCHVENSILSHNTFLNNSDHIEIAGSQHITVKNNMSVGARNALGLVNSHYVTVSDNVFREALGNGITQELGSSNNHFIGNTIEDVARSGIVLSDNNTAEGNTINRAGWFGIEIRHASNNIVRNNYVSHNSYGGIVVSAAQYHYLADCVYDYEGKLSDCGVDFPLSEGPANNNLIAQNTVALNGGAGILIGGMFEDAQGTIHQTDGNSVVDNIIYGNQGMGIDLTKDMHGFHVTAPDPVLGTLSEIFIARPDGLTRDDSNQSGGDYPSAPTLTGSTRPTNSSAFLYVSGTLDAQANSQYSVSLFANSAAHELILVDEPFIASQGESLLDSTIIRTDNNGHADFRFPITQSDLMKCSVALASGIQEADACIAAVATEILSIDGQTGASSEFSNSLILHNE